MSSKISTTVGLYLHIPFCARKCAYCDFYSVVGDDALMDAYTKALSKQLTGTASHVAVPVDTIYFGGGTPSLFGTVRIDGLLQTIQKHYTLTPGAEITLEANPDSITPDSLRRWRQSGVNRLSVGVQALDDARLAGLGRLHTAAQAAQAITAARDAGFGNLSVDLLYGLPGQSLADWQDILRQIVTWPVTHISGYGLKLEPGTPLFDAHNGRLPVDDDLIADQYLCMAGILESAGFQQYESSNFAKPGCESRHNLKYWTLQPYLGFGPGAHSDFGGRRFAVVRDLNEYINGITTGGDILTSNEIISPTERIYEYIIFGLRTTHGINEAEYNTLSPRPDRRPFDFLAQCQTAGLAVQSGDRWRLTPKGFLVSNQIIGRILDKNGDPPCTP